MNKIEIYAIDKQTKKREEIYQWGLYWFEENCVISFEDDCNYDFEIYVNNVLVYKS